MKGNFIAFEGANGVGKSTIIKLIAERLSKDNYNYYLTREPTDSELGNYVRTQAENLKGKALACLVAADRFNHVKLEIEKELRLNRLVLCDRYILSAFVFNKMDGVSFEFTNNLYEGLLYPNAIILFEANPKVITERLIQREQLTRYEQMEFGYEQDVINQSKMFLRNKGLKIYEVSTECSIDDTVQNVMEIIKNYL